MLSKSTLKLSDKMYHCNQGNITKREHRKHENEMCRCRVLIDYYRYTGIRYVAKTFTEFT